MACRFFCRGAVPNDAKPTVGHNRKMKLTWRSAFAAMVALVALCAACTADSDPIVAPAPSTEATEVPAPAEAVQPPAPSPAATPVAAPTDEPALSLDSIDFRDGFTYATDVGPLVTVVDGEGSHGEFGDEDFVSLVVADVVFGDLDRDGHAEAAVATVTNTGGSGQFSQVEVFDFVDGMLDTVGVVFGGDRAHGGIYDIDVSGDVLIVEQFSTTNGACCPEMLVQSRWALTPQNMVALESFPPRTFHSVGSGLEDKLKFLSGTTSAALAYYAPLDPTGVLFEAGKGQVVTVEHVEGPTPESILLAATTAAWLVPVDDSGVVLPADGVYELLVMFPPNRSERTTMTVTIDDADSTPVPTWASRFDHVVLHEEPAISATVAWPELLPDERLGFDAEALNDAIEEFARSGVGPWLQNIEIPTEDSDVDLDRSFGEGTYELGYQVTLVSADLVSVHFDYYEYVCCRPYPNLGQRSLVVDLAASRIVDVGEFVDLTRLDELQRHWADALERDDPELGDFVLDHPSPIRFTAMSLVPEGLELGTDRGEFGAVVGPLRAVIPWDELGDLVDPVWRERARLGRAPQTPISTAHN